MRYIKNIIRVIIYLSIAMIPMVQPIHAEGRYVIDETNTLSRETISSIEMQAKSLEEINDVVVKIEIIERLGLETLESRSQRAFTTIDKTDEQVGILIFLAVEDQKYRMMATPNLENALNVVNFIEVRDQILIPNLVAGNFEKGIRDTYFNLQSLINPNLEIAPEIDKALTNENANFIMGVGVGMLIPLALHFIITKKAGSQSK